MRKLLEQLKLLQVGMENGVVNYNLQVEPLIQRIKKYDAKHPFANLGLPTEDYEFLQEVLKS